MRRDGISGECIYPSAGLYAWNIEDAPTGEACCRIYNDWIADRLASRSPRFRCAGMVPTWSADAAVAEVARIADLGLAAAMLPLVGKPEYNDRRWHAPLARDRGDRAPGRDAPGQRSRHALLPRTRCRGREPALDPVDGAARRCAARYVGCARRPPRPPLRVRRDERGLALVGDVHGRLLLRGIPAVRGMGEADPAREAEPLHAAADPRDVPVRSGRGAQPADHGRRAAALGLRLPARRRRGRPLARGRVRGARACRPRRRGADHRQARPRGCSASIRACSRRPCDGSTMR